MIKLMKYFHLQTNNRHEAKSDFSDEAQVRPSESTAAALYGLLKIAQLAPIDKLPDVTKRHRDKNPATTHQWLHLHTNLPALQISGVSNWNTYQLVVIID